jgi:antitoxin VapB
MPLTLKNPEVERLLDEVAGLTGETKTEAVRRALEERRERLRLRVSPGGRAERLQRFLAGEAWPQVPADQRGRRLTRDEEEAILGLGPEGA